MQIKTFNSFNPEHTQLYEQILLLTQSIDIDYPEYVNWFRTKFISGLKKKERLYIIAQDENQTLVGCALLKNTPQEKKICTLFVDPRFRKKGLGKQLLQQSIKQLGEYPLITVSNRNLPQLSHLLEHCGFHLSAIKKNVYNPNDVEYYFNDQKADIIKDKFIPVLLKRMNQLKQK